MNFPILESFILSSEEFVKKITIVNKPHNGVKNKTTKTRKTLLLFWIQTVKISINIFHT